MLVKRKKNRTDTPLPIVATYCREGTNYSAIRRVIQRNQLVRSQKVTKQTNVIRLVFGPKKTDWFTLTEAEFLKDFEILHEEPVRFAGETACDIAEWHGHWHADPITSMSNEIHQLQEMISKTQAIIQIQKQAQSKMKDLIEILESAPTSTY